MKNDTVRITKLGIHFTEDTIHSMRWFLAECSQNENYVLLWGILPDSEYGVKVGLGAGPTKIHSAPPAIEDHVDGLIFYWNTKEVNLEFLRRNYCINYKYNGEKIELIPLSTYL